MFGLTEEDMDLYKELTQNFAVEVVAPMIGQQSKFITHMVTQDGKEQPDKVHINRLVTDVETVITLTVAHMAYDYAYLQYEGTKEVDILKRLHNKYDTYLMSQFIKYGITFTTDVFGEVLGSILSDLPFIYASVTDDDINDEEYIGEKLEAYDQYIQECFSEEEEEEEEGYDK